MVFVRVVGDPPVVHVWSPVVNEITDDSRAFLQELNQRNLGARFVRFASLDDTLIASHELFGRPFVPAHLIYAVSLIGDLAESIDAEFCDRFGGHARSFPSGKTIARIHDGIDAEALRLFPRGHLVHLIQARLSPLRSKAVLSLRGRVLWPGWLRRCGPQKSSSR